MQLPNPKELKALLKVCREYGVTDIRVDTLELKLGELPKDSKGSAEYEADIGPDGLPLPQGISAEDLANWSAAPDPLAARMSQAIPGKQ